MQTHVLVVEDSKELRDVLVLALTQKGFSVDGSESYSEAKEKIALKKPDVLLCDIMMPGEKNGLDLAKEIRENPETANVFVVIMTDSTNMNYVADAALSNIALYIQKAETDPFQIADQIAQKVAGN